jgi:DNA primase
MAFSPSFLDEIRNRISLVTVISRRVRLTRKGREHSGLCPFHNEKSPSFTVNEDKGFYHCFGCGAHGDVITFEMQTHHLSFPDAVERLAGEAGLEVPVQAPEDRERAKRAASLHDAMEAACVFYEKELRGPGGHVGLDYFRARGLDDQTIARFRLGYSPDSRMALKHALKAGGVPEALSIEAGLLISPEGGGDSYDRFRGRVMFPITDRRGRIIAFGGRILADGQPKYLNSPDTPLFHKGSVLYGLAQAREPAAQKGAIIVCEGYMDVIALNRAGFTHAVAPLGTALTESQIELLWRMAPEPIICLDGDAAGQRAAAKAAERALPLLKPGLSLRFATVPAPEDPDSLIRARGPAAMQEILDRAQPLSEVIWQMGLANHPIDTPERRAALEKHFMDEVGLITDHAVQEHYKRAYKDRLWEYFRAARPRPQQQINRAYAPQRAGQGRFGKLGQTRPRASDRGADGRLPGAGRPSLPSVAWQTQERLLLTVVICHPGLLEEVAERLGSLHFSDSTLDKLRQEVLKHLDRWSSLDSEGVQLHLRSCGFSQILDSLLEANVYEMWAFTRPDASADAARLGWEHTFKLYLRRELEADQRRAEGLLAADTSDETFGLLRALKSEDQGSDT